MTHEPSTSAVAGEAAHTQPGAVAQGPQRRPHAASGQVPATLVPETGWHFLHLFYRVDRDRLRGFSALERESGRRELSSVVEAKCPGAIEQLQVFAVPGHKADFGVMLAGPDLKAVHAVQMAIASSSLGPALLPVYSFYSITEVSEYVPDAEEYGRILRDRENMDPETSVYKAKVTAYTDRLATMNRQRLQPDFPDWPCLCFYPMSKMRSGEQNWYLLPFETRSELMAHHGRSGMKFAGRVTQVITASTGLDNWEWGVTLWARNPLYLKDIVYTMRFDESSARYALFGDFYFGYILPPEELFEVVRL
jgi:hydrogen peroxide-dependent heme synthase